jgi:hypothetical protein
VKRDKLKPNQLTFLRKRDALSSLISASVNRSLTTVQLTDWT